MRWDLCLWHFDTLMFRYCCVCSQNDIFSRSNCPCSHSHVLVLGSSVVWSSPEILSFHLVLVWENNDKIQQLLGRRPQLTNQVTDHTAVSLNRSVASPNRCFFSLYALFEPKMFYLLFIFVFWFLSLGVVSIICLHLILLCILRTHINHSHVLLDLFSRIPVGF